MTFQFFESLCRCRFCTRVRKFDDRCGRSNGAPPLLHLNVPLCARAPIAINQSLVNGHEGLARRIGVTVKNVLKGECGVACAVEGEGEGDEGALFSPGKANARAAISGGHSLL